MATRKVFCGKQLAVALALAMGLCGLVSSAMAEDVARALVTYGGATVKLYTIDDAGVWTAGGNFITTSDGRTSKAWRTICRNGSVYVLDQISNDKTASAWGRVNRYSLSGEFQETVATIHGAMLDDFIFSKDGKHIYFSDFESVNNGTIWHYDVETGDTNIVCRTSSTGGPRQLSWGPDDGYLYVADRGVRAIIRIDLSTGEMTNFATGMIMVCGLYYDEDEGVFYASNTGGTIYRVGQDGSVVSIGSPMNNRQLVYMTKVCGLVSGGSLSHPSDSSYKATVVQYYKDDGGADAFKFVLEESSNISSLCEIPLFAPDAEWKLDDATNALSYVDEVSGVAITPSRLLQSGVEGVDGGAIWFNESSFGRFEDSKTMIPATNDFTVAFWAGLPAAVGAAERTLFSNASGAAGDVTVAVAAGGNALRLSFREPGGTLLSAVSASDFADGTWHHVALCRRGTALSLFIDGTQAASLTLPADAAVAQTAFWHIGATALGTNPAGVGACIDDVQYYGKGLPANAIANIANEFTAGALPSSAPALPAASPLPAALGSEVMHRRGLDASIADPMLFKMPNGPLYMAIGRGDGFRDADRATEFRSSTDGGATWTDNAAPELAAGSVSLFEKDGNLYAIGLKNTGDASSLRTFAVWQLSAGAWVEKASCAGASGDEYSLGTGSVAFYSSNNRFYKAATCYYGGTNSYPAYVSFAYSGGVFSDGSVTVTAVNGAPIVGAAVETCTVADVLPGDTLILKSGDCRGYYSFVDKRGTGKKFRIGPERARSVQFKTRSNYDVKSPWMLPGGSKPYSIKYDATSKLYWAVTVPVTNRLEMTQVDPFTIAKRLGVYASPDLDEWWPCGVLLESDAATFRAPSFEIVGDDMVIVYGVAADDDAGGARGFDRPNYLAVRRVAGFRTALVPEKPNGRYLLAASIFSIRRYWQTSDGQWMPGSTFASGTFGGTSMNAIGIVTADNAVYAGGERSGARIFVYNRKGKYLRTLEKPDASSGQVDTIRFAANGKDLIVTDAYATKAVYKVDPETGTWTQLVSVGTYSGLVGRVRDAIEAPDGTLYVAANGGVFSFDAQGGFLRKFRSNAHVGLALDVDGNRLFCSNQDGNIYKINLSTFEETTVQNRGANMNSALQIQWVDGRLLVADAYNYYAYSVNPDALNEEDVFLTGCTSFARYAFIDENKAPGFVLQFK